MAAAPCGLARRSYSSEGIPVADRRRPAIIRNHAVLVDREWCPAMAAVADEVSAADRAQAAEDIPVAEDTRVAAEDITAKS